MRHSLCDLCGECLAAHKTAQKNYCGTGGSFIEGKPHMLALAGQPQSPLVILHAWFIGIKRHSGEIAGKNMVRPLFLLQGFFCLVGILMYGFGVLSSGICGLVEPGTMGQPPLLSRLVEVFNVGVWLTHGDLALEVRVDFLAVVEHRLIPARVRSEWARLKRKG